jgi:hypothetical protein
MLHCIQWRWLPNRGPPTVSGYDLGDYFDEIFAASGDPRPHYQKLIQELAGMPDGQLPSAASLLISPLFSTASRSPCTATAAVPSGFYILIWCRVFCRARNGTVSNAASRSVSLR